MATRWEEYLEERFRAQKGLVKVLRYQGIGVDRNFDPETVDEFRIAWGEKINPGDRTGVLERDAIPQPILLPNGHTILIIFVSAAVNKIKVPKTTIRAHLLNFIQLTTGWNGEQAFSQIELIPDRECILISYVPLDGSARNEITEFNAILQYPIRHFTVAELQFDPTEHEAGPSRIDILTPAEIQEYLARERGLVINGAKTLVPDYERRLAEIRDENKRAEFIAASEEEILTRIPTMNTNDPYVKWRGFKVGQVLRITRRCFGSKVVYRRVILVEPMETKPPKIKVKTTTK